MFKKRIQIGDSIETLVFIMERLEESNVPYKLGIKDIVLQPSEKFSSKENDKEYKINRIIKVRKKYVEQAEAIINQYVSEQDIEQEFKLAKKISKKLERKERFIRFLECLILLIPLKVIGFGKSEGISSVTFIASTALFLSSVYMIAKYYKELREEEEGVSRFLILLVIPIYIGALVYAIISFLSILR